MPPLPVTVPRGDVTTWMTALDQVQLAAHVAACNSAVGPAKGKPLEQFLVWLLAHVPGFEVTLTNIFNHGGSNEVDLTVWNGQLQGGFPSFGDSILVECKNWSEPVDSSAVAWFDWKMRLGGATIGILVAANGITGVAERTTAAWSIVSVANMDGRRILVVTLAELAALTCADDLRKLLVRKASLLTANAAQA